MNGEVVAGDKGRFRVVAKRPENTPESSGRKSDTRAVFVRALNHEINAY